MGTDEFTPGGLTIDDSARIAGELAADGLVDYLSLSQGNFNSIDRHLPDRHSPPATFVEQNVHIKAAAGGLPVVTSGRIETPEQAETIIASGKADVVGRLEPTVWNSTAATASRSVVGPSCGTELSIAVRPSQSWLAIATSVGSVGSSRYV